jgi:transposase-like protein
MAHANARLGPAGRRQLVHLICELGYPERRAAECFGVSRATAHRWKRRWLSSGEQLRQSGEWALDEDVPLAVELRGGDPVSEFSQAGVAATSGTAVAVDV